ncbi:MAG: Phosphoribosylamine--glycine ligase [Planctomycetes bacterium]|nr:Phosphoribosylamine--glycine ligase [Planctomycetota bacterium]
MVRGLHSPVMGHRILVVGGGGREHALAWKIAASPLVDRVLCAPGNPGTRAVAENHAVKASDADGISKLVRREKVDLVVVGPEDPLALGLADRLRKEGVLVFGPGAAGAQIESSKAWAKDLMRRYGIPTAASRTFDRFAALRAWFEESQDPVPCAIKADGLAAGKGVVIPQTVDEALEAAWEMMEEKKFGDAGKRVIVEEFLRGRELSVFSITDGRTIAVLEPAQDYKRVGDGDTGPNTGGMGAVCPAPAGTPEVMDAATREILVRTVHALARDGVEYRGCIFTGLMATRAGPKVIEFNCRFGDPETQAVLRRMTSDIVPLLVGAASGRLADVERLEWDQRPSVCVVVASPGYPGKVTTGDAIVGLEAAGEVPGVVVFHAGTAAVGDRVITAGGRVLSVTAVGDTVAAARAAAYEAVSRISFSGMVVRRDIAADAAR